MRAWLALALVCWLLPAWAQTPPPAQKKKAARPAAAKAQKEQKAQKAHRKATAEQVRKFNELQRKQDANR